VPASSVTGEPEHFDGSGFRLEFVLENKTRNDYTVPSDFKLFSRDDRSSALSEIKVTFDHPFVVPAKERAEVTADIEYSCRTENMETGITTERPADDCFNEEFGHMSGLVGFDSATHTRVDIPKPTFQGGIPAGEASARPGPGANNDLGFRPAKPVEHGPWEDYQKPRADDRVRMTAPDKGDTFDRIAACMVADKLVISCKAQHFPPRHIAGDPYAELSWQDPLPTLPRPPAGATLDPNAGTCGAAYQWDNYCRAKKMSK